MYGDAALAYHVLYAQDRDYAEDAGAVIAQVRAAGVEARSLLDVGCGTGLHVPFWRSVYDSVEGVDSSAAMLEIARRANPEVTFHHDDVRTMDLERTYDVAVWLFSGVAHLVTTTELEVAMLNIARHVTPGGVFVLDGFLRPQAWLDGPNIFMEEARRDNVAVQRMTRSFRDGGEAVMEMHFTIGTDSGVKQVVEHARLGLFSDRDYRDALRRAGFRLEATCEFMADRDRYVAVRHTGS